MKKIRVLIAEDHTIVRQGLSALLRSEPDMEVTGEASDGVEAVEMAEKLIPDVVLMDIDMPGKDGIEAVKDIRKLDPEIKILMQTVFDDTDKIFSAICNGAHGYLLKNTPPLKIIESIQDVYQGGAPMTPEVASKVLKIGYKLTDSWPLAVIGYNHGPSGVNRRVKQFHTRDIGLLLSKYKSGFGFASRNFYPCFLAVLNVESNASHFFKNIKWSEKLTSVPYKTPIPLKYREIVKWFDKDPERARVHNPHLTPLVRKANLTIPAGAPIEIPRVLAEEIDKELMFRAAQKHSTKKRKGNLARSLETPL